MAKGVELASGYISLSVKYSGAMAQIAKDLDKLEDSAKSAGKKSSAALESEFGKTAKVSAKKIKEIDDVIASSAAYFTKRVQKSYQEAMTAREQYTKDRADLTEMNKQHDRSVESLKKLVEEEKRVAASRREAVSATERFNRENKSYLQAMEQTKAVRAHMIQQAERDAARSGSTLSGRIATAVKTPLNAVRAHAGGLFTWLGSKVRSFGGTLVSALTGPMARLAGATAALGAAGFVFSKGFQQVAGIDRARKALEAANYSARDFNQMMKSIETSMKGTQYGVTDLIETATKAVQAGIEPGAPLQQYLTRVQDISAATGKSIADIDHLYDRAKLRGQVYLDDLRQLTSQRAPVEKWVIDELFGGSTEGLQYAIENQLLTWDTVLGVVERKSKGVAVAMGNTVEGQLKRVANAVGNIGAAIIEPFFGDLGGGFNGIIDKLEGFASWLREHQPEIIGFVGTVAKGFVELGQYIASFAADALKAIGALLVGFGKLPFVDEKAMVDAARSLGVWEFELRKTAENLEKKVVPGIDRWKTGLQRIAELRSAIAIRDEDGKAIGSATATLNGSRIELVDFEGEKQKLEDLGFVVKEIGGDPTHLELQAKTEEAKKTIDALREQEGKEPLFFRAHLDDSKFKSEYEDLQKFLDEKGLKVSVDMGPLGDGRSTGEILYGPWLGGWLDDLLGTGNGGSKMSKWAAGRGGGYGLPRGTNSGGYGGDASVFPAWVHQVAKTFGIKPSTYPGHQSDDRKERGYAPNPMGLNRGIDWTGPVQNLQRFAEYLERIPSSVEQAIWQNPVTGRKTGIGGGRINVGYYPQSTYDSHGGNDPSNIHVHTRHSMPLPLLGGGRGNVSYWSGLPRTGPGGGIPVLPKSIGSLNDLPMAPATDTTDDGGTPHGGTLPGVAPYPIAGQPGKRPPNPWGWGPAPSDILQQQLSQQRAQDSLDQMNKTLDEMKEELAQRESEIAEERKKQTADDQSIYDEIRAGWAEELEGMRQEIEDYERDIGRARQDMQLDQMRWDEQLQNQQWDAMNPGSGQQGGWPGGPMLPDLGQLGNIMQNGLAESFLPPGFANPFDTPILKAGSGILSFIGGLMPDPFTRGIFQAAAGVMGGDGGRAGAAMMSMIPQPFGTMQAASPGYAPGADFINPSTGPGFQLPVGAAMPGVEQLTQQPGPYGPPTGPAPGPGNGGTVIQNFGPNYQGASIGQPGKDFVDMQNRDATANARANTQQPQRMTTGY